MMHYSKFIIQNDMGWQGFFLLTPPPPIYSTLGKQDNKTLAKFTTNTDMADCHRDPRGTA